MEFGFLGGFCCLELVFLEFCWFWSSDLNFCLVRFVIWFWYCGFCICDLMILLICLSDWGFGVSARQNFSGIRCSRRIFLAGVGLLGFGCFVILALISTCSGSELAIWCFGDFVFVARWFCCFGTGVLFGGIRRNLSNFGVLGEVFLSRVCFLGLLVYDWFLLLVV